MEGLINNQRFPKLSRGTLPNETVHSVLNAKGVGKGWKSYDLLKVSICQETRTLLQLDLSFPAS